MTIRKPVFLDPEDFELVKKAKAITGISNKRLVKEAIRRYFMSRKATRNLLIGK